MPVQSSSVQRVTLPWRHIIPEEKESRRFPANLPSPMLWMFATKHPHSLYQQRTQSSSCMESPLLCFLAGAGAVSPVPHSLGSWCHSISPLMGVKLLLLSVPASRVLQLLSAGPRCCFLFHSWILSHGIACHHWATLIQLCVLPFGSWVMALTWHCWGYAAAALYPVPWSQRQDFDPPSPGCAVAAPPRWCHYCISPSWGH